MPAGNVSTTITPSPDKSSGTRRLRMGGLLQSRVCLVPTWRGWALLLLVATCFTLIVGRQLCALLSVNDPVPGGVLVVEGWVPTYAAREALDEFQRRPYTGIYVTGEPIEEGTLFSSYQNLADYTAAKLIGMGAAPASVHAVRGPYVDKDRTYSMAETLKKRLEDDGIPTEKITVISLGVHSRRSQLLYQMTFGPNSRVGMLAVVDRDFDPNRWWQSSAGVRSVIDETIAYIYARVIFRPPAR